MTASTHDCRAVLQASRHDRHEALQALYIRVAEQSDHESALLATSDMNAIEEHLIRGAGPFTESTVNVFVALGAAIVFDSALDARLRCVATVVTLHCCETRD